MKKRVNGSVTVEACFIGGLTVTVLAALIWFGLYMRDRSVIRSALLYYKEEVAAILSEPAAADGKLSLERLGEDSLVNTLSPTKKVDLLELSGGFRKRLENALLISRPEKTDARLTDRGICLEYRCSFRLPTGNWFLKILPDEGTVSGSVEVRTGLEPEEFLRICRGIIWRKDE